MQAISTEEHYV